MSNSDEIKKLISNYNRRLQKLKEQEALQGISIDPKVPLEVEDIETRIAELRTELRNIQRDSISSGETETRHSFFDASPTSKKLQIPTAIWVAMIGATATIIVALIPYFMSQKPAQSVPIIEADSNLRKQAIQHNPIPSSENTTEVNESFSGVTPQTLANNANVQERDCSSKMAPLDRLVECEYEFGWAAGKVNNYDSSKRTFVKVTEIELYFGSVLAMVVKYDWEREELHGILDPESGIYLGNWIQEDEDTGDFELIFNSDFTEATGWWSVNENSQKYWASLRMVND